MAQQVTVLCRFVSVNPIGRTAVVEFRQHVFEVPGELGDVARAFGFDPFALGVVSERMPVA